MSSLFRLLIAASHGPLRKHIYQILAQKPWLQLADVSDDYELLHNAETLRPDVVLLDIGLPGFSRLELTRRVRKSFPNSKVLLLCESAGLDLIEEAIALGAQGFLERKNLSSDLLSAVEAVCHNRRYFGAWLPVKLTAPPSATTLTPRHEVQFYSDDLALIEGLVAYLADSLKAGNRTVVIATEAHRQAINHRLWAQPLDWPAVTEEGLYISLDTANVLSEFMDDTGPNRARFFSFFEPLFQPAQTVARDRGRRMVAFGEMVALLCAQGKPWAALEVEKLWNEVLRVHDLHLRCAYPLTTPFEEQMYAQICREHDAVHALQC
jgi:DNA-binding NarL/FixJ family response regulator